MAEQKKDLYVMGLRVPRLFEKRNVNSLGTLENPSKTFLEIIGGGKSASGQNVSESSSQTISAFYRALCINSSAVASLPRKVFAKNQDETRQTLKFHPVHKLFQLKPNPYQTSFIFFQTMQRMVLMHGNAYAFISFDAKMRPLSLDPIHPNYVDVAVIDRELYYRINLPDFNEPVPAWQLLHIKHMGDGLKGKSVLEAAREAMGGALAIQDYTNKLYKSGGAQRVAIKYQGKLKPETRKVLRETWSDSETDYSRPVLLEAGEEVTPIGISPKDAELLGSRKLSIQDISNFTGVPTYMLGDSDKPSYNSFEQQSIDFLVHSLRPWLVNWEQEMNDKLFYEKEKLTHYTEHIVEGLLRADSASRATFYKDLINTGIMSPNQAAKKENLPVYEGGDDHYMQSNMATVKHISEGKTLKQDKTNEQEN